MKRNMRLGSLCALTVACFTAAVSCGASASDYVYEAPKQLDDGWKVSTLEAEGMNTDIITRLTNKVIDGKIRGIHSILIVKNGAIVYEMYFGEYDRDSLHTMYSITKSVTSGLVGIAIDNGLIGGVDQAIEELLPEYSDAIKDDRLKDVTAEQLLTMSSGLEWDEWTHPYCDPRNSEYPQVQSNDWVKNVLELPMRDKPGSRWVYNTGGVHLLSAIIRSRTGMYADQFAEKYLFEPLGITQYSWNTDPKRYAATGGTRGGLKLRTRDIAKFGMVYMREGKWNGKQVISEEWVRESTANHITTVRNTGYGYLWWLKSYTIRNKQIDTIYGAGYGGQSLGLVPELDLMYVFTSWGRAEDADIFGPMVMIFNSALTE
jgi:CubicO group peptidase (beta-lactamase class C family)